MAELFDPSRYLNLAQQGQNMMRSNARQMSGGGGAATPQQGQGAGFGDYNLHDEQQNKQLQSMWGKQRQNYADRQVADNANMLSQHGLTMAANRDNTQNSLSILNSLMNPIISLIKSGRGSGSNYGGNQTGVPDTTFQTSTGAPNGGITRSAKPMLGGLL